MCGRFVSSSSSDEIAKYFGADEVAESVLEPDYNVAPTQDVYAVLESGSVRRVEPLHWGLVPRWAKDVKIGNRMINARAETVAEKNAFSWAFKKRRCIIPADGFYEWTLPAGQEKKQPWFIHRPDDEPLALAGLWEVWRGPDRDRDDALVSCTIITTEANDTLAEIHDRMPLILPPVAWSTWLDREQEDLDTLGRLLVPAPNELVTMHPVSTDVNNARNGGAHLLDPVDPPTSAEGD